MKDSTSMIAKNIRHLRSSENLSQEIWGSHFKLNRGQVDSYERSVAKPASSIIAAISSRYKIPVDVLLTRDLSTNPGLMVPGVFDGSANMQQSLTTLDVISAKDETIKILRDQVATLQQTINAQIIVMQNLTTNKTKVK